MGLESISNSELSLGLTLGAPVVKPGKNRRPWRLDDLRVPPAMAGNLQKWMFIIPYHKSPGSQKHIPETVCKALQTHAFLGRRQKSTFSVALGFPPWFSPFPPGNAHVPRGRELMPLPLAQTWQAEKSSWYDSMVFTSFISNFSRDIFPTFHYRRVYLTLNHIKPPFIPLNR